jgi:hypothetical protein
MAVVTVRKKGVQIPQSLVALISRLVLRDQKPELESARLSSSLTDRLQMMKPRHREVSAVVLVTM